MYFCIFSFNRGRFLENCVESIEHCVQDPVILIFDDESNDPETVSILDALSKHYQVIQPEKTEALAYKCGGLYNNMQSSLSYIPEGELVYFVQDDTQLVRKLNEQDINDIECFFNEHPDAAFLHHAFVRQKNRSYNQKTMEYHQDSHAYIRNDSNRSSGIYFSALSIAHVDRLKAANWVFKPTEKENELQARTKFSKMGIMRDPFVMWLPSVPCYRGKVKTLALTLAEKKQNCGFYPFEILSDEKNRAFKVRHAKILPTAEDFLTVSNATLKKPWITHPLQSQPLLKWLNKLEINLRKWSR
ncbi:MULTISPECIES: glycosyltransferase family 2 protein [Halomonadaceae]|uniref:Glycosyltransferase n=1 Tax=Vreelandella halophila TaxID=86177 RepID=A0A9X5B4B0_9GAMM|nr:MULTISPECIES: glycosyltransferase [Halomonas]MYL26185.1 hypothetical protein [Halomonas utahensis]MYL73253.1 hypothetical protein [Halomonas sp. 22501_18_FS]